VVLYSAASEKCFWLYLPKPLKTFSMNCPEYTKYSQEGTTEEIPSVSALSASYYHAASEILPKKEYDHSLFVPPIQF
jgi:hypothetical protein